GHWDAVPHRNERHWNDTRRRSVVEAAFVAKPVPVCRHVSGNDVPRGTGSNRGLAREQCKIGRPAETAAPLQLLGFCLSCHSFTRAVSGGAGRGRTERAQPFALPGQFSKRLFLARVVG